MKYDPREEMTDFIALADDQRPSLGDPAVLNELVTQWAVDVIEARKGYNAGDLNPGQAMDAIKKACDALTEKLRGRDKAFNPQQWFNDERLGRHLLNLGYGAEGEQDKSVGRFVEHATALFMDAIVQFENGESTDEQARLAVDAAKQFVFDTARGIS